MSRDLDPCHAQLYLLPPSVDSLVSEDDPVRFVDAFVESLDLAGLGFDMGAPGTDGRPRYGTALLLKVWLYGYMNRIRSTRDLERACRMHLGFLWLVGQLRPDHNTLWRFFRANRDALVRTSKRVSRVAADLGVLGMVLHAVDGTKIEAVSSRETGFHRESLEKKLTQVEERIARWLAEIERVEEEQGSESEEARLPWELQDARAMRARIRQRLAALDAEGRSHLHPEEPDCSMLKCEGRIRFAYNAQAVVDEKSGLIVAGDVVTDGADNHLLVPMLERVEEVLEGTASDTVADGGYASAETAQEIDQRGYDATFSVDANAGRREESPYHVSRFEYDPASDCFRCPFGGELRALGAWRAEGSLGYRVRRYRCASFTECAHRGACSPSRRGRTIKATEHVVSVARMRDRATSPEGKARLSRRKVIVEPVFGWIKQGMGFRRWTVRGLASVRAQWAVVCTALNLKRLAVRWAAGDLVPPPA